MSPALAGVVFTTQPPGKPPVHLFYISIYLISFTNTLWFSAYISYIPFIRFIPLPFFFFLVLPEMVLFFSFNFQLLAVAYRNTVDFVFLISCNPVKLTHSLKAGVLRLLWDCLWTFRCCL